MDQVAAKVKGQFDQAVKAARSTLNVIEVDGKYLDERPEELRRIEGRIGQHVRAVFPGSEVRLRFNFPGVEDLVADATLELRDKGPWTPPEAKGQGFQRMLYVALLRSLAEEIRASEGAEIHRPFLLLFEEPEAFLHPGLQREVGDVLETIAQENQVILATHSPIMVTPGRIRIRHDFPRGDRP